MSEVSVYFHLDLNWIHFPFESLHPFLLNEGRGLRFTNSSYGVQITQVGEEVERALSKFAPPKVGVRYATCNP